MELEEVTIKIKDWLRERSITVNGSANSQTIKLGEEFGELCSGIAREDSALIKDSIGDMYVVLVAISELYGMAIEDCIESAYEEIKDRKGHLNKDGIFIKEET